ncbi:MAG: threonine synthase [Alphaproteobacteria bacterium]
MRYISTRGAAPALPFDDVLLAGLAEDGGLYVPEFWPNLDAPTLESLRGLSYDELAVRVMAPFIAGTIADAELAAMAKDAYRDFGHRVAAPLRQLDTGLWLLDLTRGPTLAFKDYAMQLVGRMFDLVLKRRGRRVTIVGATSGDTGAAAIEACRGRAAIDIFILHPRGRVSEVQRRLMTTVTDSNVHNIAIDGTFDDCQDLVKAMFADRALRERLGLSAVNSINWARVMAQIVYYVAAAIALGAPARAVAFSVPTGNFGNVLAAYGARRMGLPISQLVVASNANDILHRFLETGRMEMGAVVPTLSPSMDIQVSSNFERLLFEILDRDGPAVARAMAGFRKDGRLTLEQSAWREVRALFDGHREDDAGTLAAMAAEYNASGELLDPHTAIGVAAARARRRDAVTPIVALATAHPAKFPDAVERATGLRPSLPARLADLFEREERVATLPNDLGAVKAFVAARVALKGAA